MVWRPEDWGMHQLALPPPVDSRPPPAGSQPLPDVSRPPPVESRPIRAGILPTPPRLPNRRRPRPSELPPPLQPELVPTHPAAGSQACSHPVFLGKSQREEGIRKVRGKKIEKGIKRKGQVKRKSLGELTRELGMIRKNLEEREKEIREVRQIQFSLRVRKERLQRLESSHSPLFDLYRNRQNNSEKKCILCGHVKIDPCEKEASAVPGFPVHIDSNPLNLGVPSRDQVEEEGKKLVEAKENFAATQRRRREQPRNRNARNREVDPEVERRRRWQRVVTAELVDATVAPPPPPILLGEERRPATFGGSEKKEEDLVDLHREKENMIEWD